MQQARCLILKSQICKLYSNLLMLFHQRRCIEERRLMLRVCLKRLMKLIFNWIFFSNFLPTEKIKIIFIFSQFLWKWNDYLITMCNWMKTNPIVIGSIKQSVQEVYSSWQRYNEYLIKLPKKIHKPRKNLKKREKKFSIKGMQKN